MSSGPDYLDRKKALHCYLSQSEPRVEGDPFIIINDEPLTEVNQGSCKLLT